MIALAAATALTGIAAPATDWTEWRPAAGVVDVAGPRSDGWFVMMAGGRLRLLARNGRARPFAPRFKVAGGEPYIDVAPANGAPGGCRWPADAVAVLEPVKHAVVLVLPSGGVRKLARVAGAINGIAFDRVGGFGGSLLVTRKRGTHDDVFAIDCAGRSRSITRTAPVAEGGIAVAPETFGRFGGYLVMADELSGRIWAISPRGRHRLVANSGLPAGPDTGVESLGFVPRRAVAALVADRGVPGNPHPGTDHVLRLELAGQGLAAGDLLAVAEGGARTVAVRCRATCTVRIVVGTESTAHREGHVAFLARRG
jgi:hypothetical protein